MERRFVLRAAILRAIYVRSDVLAAVMNGRRVLKTWNRSVPETIHAQSVVQRISFAAVVKEANFVRAIAAATEDIDH